MKNDYELFNFFFSQTVDLLADFSAQALKTARNLSDSLNGFFFFFFFFFFNFSWGSCFSNLFSFFFLFFFFFSFFF